MNLPKSKLGLFLVVIFFLFFSYAVYIRLTTCGTNWLCGSLLAFATLPETIIFEFTNNNHFFEAYELAVTTFSFVINTVIIYAIGFGIGKLFSKKTL